MSVPRNPDHDDALPYGALLGETRRVNNRCKSFNARMSEINKRLDKMDEISIEMRNILDAFMPGNPSRSAVTGVMPETEESDDEIEAIKLGNLDGLIDTDVPEDEEPDNEMDATKSWKIGRLTDKDVPEDEPDDGMGATEWGNLGRLTDTDIVLEDELPDDKMDDIELENLDGLVDTDAVPEDEEPDGKMVCGIYFDKGEIDPWEPGKSSGAADTDVIPENQEPCDETTWANHLDRSAMDDIELGDFRRSADTYVPEDEKPDNRTEWENHFDRDEIEFIEYISCSASVDMVVISKVRNPHFQLRIDKWGIPIPFDRSEMDSMKLGNASGAADTDVIRGVEDSEDGMLSDAESTYCTIGGMNHHEDDEEIQAMDHTFSSEDELHTAPSSVLEQYTVDLPESSLPPVTSPRGDNSIFTKHHDSRDGAILTNTMISHEPIEEEYILLSLTTKSIHADNASHSPSLSITISKKNPNCDSLANTVLPTASNLPRVVT
ncbi:Protein of unknown function [Pyronema omphalodes CBS 100304]|uniref:Uncharacterized protein n=1 Tax=Pyronema omphalodes (strain CBS 100304) TaxID=1076935 RepID=U4KZX3_PYROM|nr:Protein of unknown function [Pyronema omphalodes CBS 100304]